MSLFSTRNHDGASGRGEPADTVPKKDRDAIDASARQHSCHSRAELFSAPSLHHGAYDPQRAASN